MAAGSGASGLAGPRGAGPETLVRRIDPLGSSLALSQPQGLNLGVVAASARGRRGGPGVSAAAAGPGLGIQLLVWNRGDKCSEWVKLRLLRARRGDSDHTRRHVEGAAGALGPGPSSQKQLPAKRDPGAESGTLRESWRRHRGPWRVTQTCWHSDQPPVPQPALQKPGGSTGRSQMARGEGSTQGGIPRKGFVPKRLDEYP